MKVLLRCESIRLTYITLNALITVISNLTKSGGEHDGTMFYVVVFNVSIINWIIVTGGPSLGLFMILFGIC